MDLPTVDRPAIVPATSLALLPSRRAVLAAAGAALLAGCSHGGRTRERVVDVASGRELAPEELLAALRACDMALLGERHDNPLHHRRRGALIAALGPGTVVVAEHLTRGRRVSAGADLQQRLQDAGFDARSWQWPLHRELFEPLLAAGVPLLGGNMPRDEVRAVSRQGDAGMPADLRALIDAAPLTTAAQAALDADLISGHCGQLPQSRLPLMRSAQRMRDASLTQALLDCGGRPAVLVAGNGHVRTDHAVPQLLRALRPQLRVMAVGFVEGDEAAVGPVPYTHVWITPRLHRSDPCAGFKLPAPASAPAAAQRTV